MSVEAASAIRTVEAEGGKFLQITVPISPGSSGGPLFNMSGKVVGITTSHIKGGENLNFAIPINNVKPLLLASSSKARTLPDRWDVGMFQQPWSYKRFMAYSIGSGMMGDVLRACIVLHR